jgi:eukaryotic-like serine/threonine-protein kinase
MLAGHRPFAGDHDATVIYGILNQEPEPLRVRRPDVPPAIDAAVRRLLTKPREERYRTAADVAKDLAAPQVAEASAGGRRGQGARRRLLAGIAAAAVAVLVAGGSAWTWWERTHTRAWARAEAIPEIQHLIEQEAFPAAFVLAERVERILPGDEALAGLWEALTVETSISTTPGGADVFVKEYGEPSADWRPLGRTPLTGVRLPGGVKRWRIEAPGFVTLERASAPGTLSFTLPLTGEVPDDMVAIPGGPARAWIAGMDPIEGVPVDDYLIDRYEVTNRKYKAFVDAGGYSRPEFWEHPFVRDGRTIAFAEAMQDFRDATGRPGPATWELGTYPRGDDDHPVSGVSWYEAAAYAEFAGNQQLGGRMAAIVPAVDRRVGLNIVVLGGLAAGRALPEVDQINYIGRVTVPVLMINGRYDAIEPLESAQLPMFRSWGTPDQHKRHVIFDTGHGPFPQNALIREVLDWLDRYFGQAT